MPRNFPDWLTGYVQYAGFSEAPRRMHFWSGVSAIAGALRRRVWFDMGYFKWYPNFYIVLVAPPGIVSKSTTASIAMNLLRRVPGINFGPDVVTWPALVTAFAASKESFQIGQDWHAECALTLESSEFGNLVNPSDREMMDLLVNLWDSKQGAFKKVTKMSGVDNVENPWINLIACTTPAWIAGAFPEYVIGGGFTSRCIFVYADEKDKYVAYPFLHIPPENPEIERKLAMDLEHISIRFKGPFTATPQAIEWGEQWYRGLERGQKESNDERFKTYLARKQTQLHKTAMVLSASRGDSMVLEQQDLELADVMLSDIERDIPKVFARIGRTNQSVQAERFVHFVHAKGVVPLAEAYAYVHSAFPDMRAFEGILKGAEAAGFVKVVNKGGVLFLVALTPK